MEVGHRHTGLATPPSASMIGTMLRAEEDRDDSEAAIISAATHHRAAIEVARVHSITVPHQ